MELKKLKSGSDIRGIAVETQNGAVQLTDEVVSRILSAFCKWLSEKTGAKSLKIAVGHDSRISADRITAAATAAITASGATVLYCGLCSTPSMFMMTKYPETMSSGALMITASHHPFDKNGLKFFTPDGGLSGADISRILQMAENGEKIVGEKAGEVVKDDYLRLYCDHLIKMVKDGTGEDTPFSGMKIAVDAGNGAGGFYAERVLKVLGADVSASQFLEPDGNFPNHQPNPENAEAMKSISAQVIKEKADFGIIFDTDVDRSAIVDADGREINRNRLIALISAVILSEKPGGTIVTDSVTSDGLKEFIETSGGKHLRFKRGYRNVIDEAVRLTSEGTDAPLAIETSGHAAFSENYYLDDGAYLVTRLMIKAAMLKKEGKTLSSLIAGLKEAKEEVELRFTITDKDWAEYGAGIIASVTQICFNLQQTGMIHLARDSHEGVRVSMPHFGGWFMLRMSVHDPVVPLNIESTDDGGAENIAAFVYTLLRPFKKLDIDTLAALLGKKVKRKKVKKEKVKKEKKQKNK